MAARDFTPVTLTPNALREVFHEGRIAFYRLDPHPQTHAARLAELLHQRLKQLDAMLELATLEVTGALAPAQFLDIGKSDEYLRSCRYAAGECLDLAALFLADPEHSVEQRVAEEAENEGSAATVQSTSGAETSVTIRREYLQIINNSLLVGLASFAELQRVKLEMCATINEAVKQYADELHIITADEEEAGRFATALHLTAQFLGAVV